MSKLIKSSAILAFARITNYSLLILSPILLVRILDPIQFGQYREFIVYAMLVANLARFSIPTNLLYFIPHQPDKTRYYVSHTNWMVISASIFACLIIWIFQGPLRTNTSFDFLVPLTIYVFLFINLDFIESYWIAKKQSRNVFYYSTFRTVIRLSAVIGTAAISKSVEAVLNSLIAVEIFRIIVTLIILQRAQILSYVVNPGVMKKQLSYIVPLGLASSLHFLNQYIGQVVISVELGVVALAIYSIGSYQVPIINIIRGAISDAIFPDMVKAASGKSSDKLQLWKRGNIGYSFITVPIFLVLTWYADILIPLLFTNQYADAVPIFRILLLVMVLQCFDFSAPLRAANSTGLLLAGNFLMIGVNVVCLLIFFSFFKSVAIFGPAVGIVLGYVIQLSFLGRCITVIYSINLADLLKWRGLALICLCTTLSCIVLFIGELIDMPDVMRFGIFSILFAVSYFMMIRMAQLEDVETVIDFLTKKLRKRV